MTRRKNIRRYDDPIRHPDHPRPKTRREFLSQGFVFGSGLVLGGTTLTLGSGSARASITVSDDLIKLCGLGNLGANKIPFICFDLAGGGNTAGSNVLIGKQGGQMDFLSTEGYSKQGLPGDMIPSAIDTVTGLNHINSELGLAFHSDSAYLRGMLSKITSPATRALINGAVIPARSENDTGNNPHNPMYGIARAGADGKLLSLIGSSNTDSGGNSMSPAMLIDVTKRPTKVDRPSDVTGLVDVGDLTSVLSQQDAVSVMESIYRISDAKLTATGFKVGATVTTDEVVKDLVRCGYLKSADLAENFGTPSQIDPAQDALIKGPTGIFSDADFASNAEYRKTASVMKMVINGFAGAGTIQMGGYDYHGGKRAEGEVKDFRAGECMGACLQYAALKNKPLMMYVFSDGSLSSNGVIDPSNDGRGKGEWTSDNQQTAATWFLVYNPTRRAVLMGSPAQQAQHQQIGWMRADGSVETASTPAANNVNLLAYTAVLNYMSLHDEQDQFGSKFPTAGLPPSLLDTLTAFTPIVNGVITQPV